MLSQSHPHPGLRAFHFEVFFTGEAAEPARRPISTCLTPACQDRAMVEELGRVSINPAASCDCDYVRFAPIATKFARQRSMSRWATSGLMHRSVNRSPPSARAVTNVAHSGEAPSRLAD